METKNILKKILKIIRVTPYKEVIQNNKDENFFYSRGLAKANLGDYKRAIKDYDKAIELKPEYGDAYCDRGVVNAKLANYKGAIKDYDTAIELNPENGVAYYNRGIAKTKLGDYKEAIVDYNKAIELNPEDGEAYSNRGIVKIKLGQRDSGCLDLNKAGELGFTTPDTPSPIEEPPYFKSWGMKWSNDRVGQTFVSFIPKRKPETPSTETPNQETNSPKK